MLRISIFDRAYTQYEIHDNVDGFVIDPIKLKLFHNDVFSFDGEKVHDIRSEIRNTKNLAGILILNDNKTYGRTANKKRLLYKCIPNNKQLPYFFVPYDIKLSINKNVANKFILFNFHGWDSFSCHPMGIITESIGDVDDTNAFYEYQLLSRGLHGNIKLFTQKTNSLVCAEEFILNESKFIFSIDPQKCTDFDDALSFTYDEETQNSCVSVYFSNVASVIDKHHLWDFLSDRVSTIYLPDRRIPMLPLTLTTKFCSLRSNQKRSTFSVDFYYNRDGMLIDELTRIHIIPIIVDKNFIYDEAALINCPSYSLLFHLTSTLNHSTKNSHDLVSYWMTQTNTYCASFLSKHTRGILRIPTGIKSDLLILNNWNRISSQYVLCKDSDLKLTDEIYSHFTSPMRRIVDLLNQIEIYNILFPQHLSNSSQSFLNTWYTKIPYINQTMKSIRKTEMQCNLLHFFTSNKLLWDKVYEGIIIQKKTSNSKFSYTVYIEELNILSQVSKTTSDLPENSVQHFQFYIFKCEHDTNRKIRLSIVYV